MGYTQYWNGPIDIDDALKADVRRIFKYSAGQGIIIRGGDGTGEPVITNDVISFNGDALENNDYETALFTNDGKWGFCKTAERPYDLTVSLVLLRIYSLNKDKGFTFDSDGEWDKEWIPARNAYKELFHEDIDGAPFHR